ncbi:sigma-70 family RNA polymerase sigma factor [Actinokineospora spheciospongiae]|uniref:sigma-70 family RNA polymerase sigma factor n=1 Tax=Actinokineospora spheciospongiae TaxID=909613 RepID=UPI001F20A9BB|nr:sigma-70 family RNA polymerase sigma factor [Actinokineospora spheciospongiae]
MSTPAEDVSMTDDPLLSDDEIEALRREDLLEDPERATPDEYPRLWNLSAGSLFRAVIRARDPKPPEYVTVPVVAADSLELAGAISQWNLLWEAAQYRGLLVGADELPVELRRVAGSGDANVMFIPRTRTRYHEYAPLFHLLPRRAVERHGLPLLGSGQWPFLAESSSVDRYLPADFEARLSRAWAATVWRHLMPGSPISGFTPVDPIRLLAHNLDFWLPPITRVMQEILRGLPVVDNGVPAVPLPLADGTLTDDVVLANPRVGADLWRGEEDAAETVVRTVEAADHDGRLRGILEAVRANRVEDDFSERWTFAREDFERKLYRKRSKVKVRFVELTDTIPVQGPETEVEDRVVFGDFMALLDERDRQVVVLLRSGYTNLTEVAGILGYRGHSPVSKRLKRIREQAARFFDER